MYFHYRAFGLHFKSEIEIPELLAVTEHFPDVLIKLGTVNSTNMPGSFIFKASYNDYFFNIDNIAKCRIQEGYLITIQPKKGATLKEIRLLLLGPIFNGLFHQRGSIQIHGSAVVKDERSIIFSGESKVGKSSLAFALNNRGYTVMADDLALIDFSKNGIPILQPGLSYLKLWKDVINYFNNKEKLEKVKTTLDKYYKPIKSSKNQTPVELDTIIILRKKDTSGFHYKELFGADKFNLLLKNSFLLHFGDDMNLNYKQFINISTIAQHCKISVIERPESPLQITELADLVIEKLSIS